MANMTGLEKSEIQLQNKTSMKPTFKKYLQENSSKLYSFMIIGLITPWMSLLWDPEALFGILLWVGAIIAITIFSLVMDRREYKKLYKDVLPK